MSSRLGGWPRTVFGRLVARRDPVRQAGLTAGGCRVPRGASGFLGAGLAFRGFPGSRLGWPYCVRWGGMVPCRAMPGPVAEPASPHHQRRSVVPGNLWVVLAQERRASAGPTCGVRRIDHDDARGRRWRSSGRACRAGARWGCPRSCRRNPRPRFPCEGRLPVRSRPSVRASVKSRSSITMARAPASLAVAIMREMAARTRPSRAVASNPASGSGIVNGAPATFPSGATTATPRCPLFTSTAITGAAVGHRAPGGSWLWAFHEASACPATPRRVIGDVIADSAGRGLRGNLITPVGEPDGARQPVAAVGPVRQVRQRGGKLDFKPALVRVPSQCLVAPCLILFAVGGEEHALRVPPLPPLRLGQPVPRRG